MVQTRISARLVLTICLVLSLGVSGTAAAAGAFAWAGSADSGGWNGFMQRIMQPDYRLQMSNGSPYWNTLMVPVSEIGATSGQTSYMGMPAFGFCPAAGQCYMVLVQSPAATGVSPACPPAPLPAQPSPNQPGKPNSLW